MALVMPFVSVAISILYTPFLLLILCIIFLASIGKSLGVRRLYVNILLKLFEYGRQHIEVATKLKRQDSDDEEEKKILDRPPSAVIKENGVNGLSKMTVIQREEILGPSPELNYKHSSSQERIPNGQAKPKDDKDENNLEFHLDHCLDLVKAGMESIIEDQVTSVFEAEELRSWNLLTRTNRQYEFLTWRVTIIWMMGFVVRYFFLFPLRLFIFILGVLFLMVSTPLVNVLPAGKVRRYFGDKSFKITFRLLTRAFSCVIFVHDVQYTPKRNGFCVANHTSPIDVAMLSAYNCYSLSLTVVVVMTALGFTKDEVLRRQAYLLCLRAVIDVEFRAFSVLIEYHGTERRLGGGVCVANHTSPILDMLVLSRNNDYTLVWWLLVSTACVGCIPDRGRRERVNYASSIMAFNFLSRTMSTVITYHGAENKPRNGICVANHTSPIDALVLMCDNTYSLIGQRHGGFLGLLQRALARASPHIWFERSEVKDRHAVARRLKEHISEPNNPPILIFPEGTCINNTSVMQFKKGSFEVGGTIYPVAIKYDPRFGDAFWNSSRYGMLHYLYMMMTSWAIVCDVWYLPPMRREEEETAVDFANRVKAVIARRGGLVDLMWDGQLKRMKPKKECKELQQEEFSKRLKGE